MICTFHANYVAVFPKLQKSCEGRPGNEATAAVSLHVSCMVYPLYHACLLHDLSSTHVHCIHFYACPVTQISSNVGVPINVLKVGRILIELVLIYVPVSIPACFICTVHVSYTVHTYIHTYVLSALHPYVTGMHAWNVLNLHVSGILLQKE